MKKCKIYQIANSGLSHYDMGYKSVKMCLSGEITKREYFAPFEPDTKEGHEWNEGACQAKTDYDNGYLMIY